MDIKTILVPTDFSPDAAAALETARDLARVFGARLVIVHAYHVDIPMMAPPLGGAYTLPAGFYEELEAQATAQVQGLSNEVAGSGVEASGVALSDPPLRAILSQAEKSSADLIVMGTRGRTGLKHVMVGSVAERVVRWAPCPVLTVKAED